MPREDERSFKFSSGPDEMTATLRRYSGGPHAGEPYISISGVGPRGGYVPGPIIGVEEMDRFADMIAEAKGWDYQCKGCGRAEDDCSHDPCPDVIADREE